MFPVAKGTRNQVLRDKRTENAVQKKPAYFQSLFLHIPLPLCFPMATDRPAGAAATVDMQLPDELLNAPAFTVAVPDTRCFLYPFDAILARLAAAACGSNRIRFRFAGHKVATLSWDKRRLRVTLRFSAAPVSKLVFQGKAFVSDLQRSKYKPDYLVGPWAAERMSAAQLVVLMYWQSALYTDPVSGVASPTVRLSTACRSWRPMLCAAAEALVVQPPPPLVPFDSIGPIGSFGSSDLDFLAVFASSQQSKEVCADTASSQRSKGPSKGPSKRVALDALDSSDTERSSSSGLSPRAQPHKRGRLEATTTPAPGSAFALVVPVGVATAAADLPMSPPVLSSAVPFALSGACAPSPLRKRVPSPPNIVSGLPYGATAIQTGVSTVDVPSLWQNGLALQGAVLAPCFVFTGTLELVHTAAL